jgi:hypothetical protein
MSIQFGDDCVTQKVHARLQRLEGVFLNVRVPGAHRYSPQQTDTLVTSLGLYSKVHTRYLRSAV